MRIFIHQALYDAWPSIVASVGALSVIVGIAASSWTAMGCAAWCVYWVAHCQMARERNLWRQLDV